MLRHRQQPCPQHKLWAGSRRPAAPSPVAGNLTAALADPVAVSRIGLVV
ncbi:hypothetical protein [Nonomuraea maritima]|nr:hypothetical protein [Nonomuraea maritima]